MLTRSIAQDRAYLRPLTTLAFLLTLLLPTLSADAQAAPTCTDVGGPIISDTTWTLVNSPYIVVENVEVWEGVTLTIEPGVTVKFNSGKKLQVNGELIVQGTTGNLITFTSNQATPAPGDWGNIEFGSTAITTTMDAEGNYISGGILQYCVVEYAGYSSNGAIDAHSLLIDHCSVRNNGARGIYDRGTNTAPGRITNNSISTNSTSQDGGGIYAEYCIVSDNTIDGNSAGLRGGGIYALYSTVTDNIVRNNSLKGGWDAYGGGIYAKSSSIISNTVTNNMISGDGMRGFYGGGIYASSSAVVSNTVDYNSLIANANAGGGSFGSYGGGIFAEGSTIISNTIRDNMASHTEDYPGQSWGGGVYATCNSVVSHNIINDNLAIGRDTAGGGILAYDYYCRPAGPVVNGNTVINNSASSESDDACGGGIYASGKITISSNIVSANSASVPDVYSPYYDAQGGGIYASSSRDRPSTVLSNTITANTVSGGMGSVEGAGVYMSGSGSVLSNTVVANTGPSESTVGGVEINGTPQVHYNNFYGNEPYDVAVASSQDISGTHNYWGTVSSVNILAQIYDWYDNSSRGRFLYIPYLQEPSPDAPFPPPTGLTADFPDNSAVLSWDAHPSFTTGYGYKVYYDTDGSAPPYAGTGLNEGDSPIDVGNQTTYTLTGLDPSKDYYFTVTAYDNEGHESWYSNVEWKRGGYWVYLPLVLRND